jgi:hypothetical protein
MKGEELLGLFLVHAAAEQTRGLQASASQAEMPGFEL